jgi:hypothetical protein
VVKFDVYVTVHRERLRVCKWSNSCPVHFTPVKEPLYPLNNRLSGPHSVSGGFGDRKKNLLLMPGFERGVSNRQLRHYTSNAVLCVPLETYCLGFIAVKETLTFVNVCLKFNICFVLEV